MSKRTVAAAVAIALPVLAGCSASGDPTADLTVGWGGSEGHPSCVYDAAAGSVECTLTIDGQVPPDEEANVKVTVTAYADENTSEEVGSSSRSVRVEGKVHQPLVVTVPVDEAPHVDEDGETACTLSADF
jgi:hypothetical protein